MSESRFNFDPKVMEEVFGKHSPDFSGKGKPPKDPPKEEKKDIDVSKVTKIVANAIASLVQGDNAAASISSITCKGHPPVGEDADPPRCCEGHAAFHVMALMGIATGTAVTFANEGLVISKGSDKVTLSPEEAVGMICTVIQNTASHPHYRKLYEHSLRNAPKREEE